MVVRTRLSLEEFLALPGIDEGRLELIDGEVSEKPMPTWGHGRIAARLIVALDPFGSVAADPRAVIPGTADRRGSAPIPDVAFYRNEADQPAADQWMSAPPTVAIEILSPGQSRQEMRAKVDLYRAFGVPCVVVVDPERRELDLYEAGGRRTLGLGAGMTLTAVPGFALAIDDLFAGLGAGA